MKLEELTPGVTVRGIAGDAVATVVNVDWHGSDALTIIYRLPSGHVAEEVLYRQDEARLKAVEKELPWRFDGDGALYRLVAEAHRIRLAHLFDPAAGYSVPELRELWDSVGPSKEKPGSLCSAS